MATFHPHPKHTLANKLTFNYLIFECIKSKLFQSYMTIKNPTERTTNINILLTEFAFKYIFNWYE